jgi:hypothetical protein
VSSSIVLEEILAYQSETLRHESFPELLADGLDDDTREFYTRMAFDIMVLATAAGWPPQPAGILRTLREALVAAPPLRAVLWRDLYRDISTLVSGCEPEAVPQDVRKEVLPAFLRMCQFLYENSDIPARA